MDAPLAVIFTLLGIAIGSFLNVCIDRLPAHQSLVSPPSRCDGCGRRLRLLDLIPIVSYLWLRGRCRYCRAPIPRRVLLVEVLGGAVFFLAFWRFGISPQFGVTAFWSAVFLVIIFIDWEHQLILNVITYPAMVVALVILGADSAWPGAGILTNLELVPQPGILSGLIGGGIGFVFFLIVFLIAPRGIGIGDIKLAGLIGLVTGIPLLIVGLLTGILLGGIVAVFLILFRLKGRKDVIPYGTFLGIGPIVAMLWGADIYQWYLGLF